MPLLLPRRSQVKTTSSYVGATITQFRCCADLEMKSSIASIAGHSSARQPMSFGTLARCPPIYPQIIESVIELALADEEVGYPHNVERYRHATEPPEGLIEERQP